MMMSMATVLVLPAWHDLTPLQAQRWDRVLGTLTTALSGVNVALIDGNHPGAAQVLADRLAFTAHQHGRHCARLTAGNPVADEDTWYAERAEATLAVADGQCRRSHPAYRTGTSPLAASH